MSRPRRVVAAGVVCAALALPALLPGAAAAEAVCDDLLVTHRPAGSAGDLDAVAITAQALDRDVAGWAMVGWDVAPGTDLRRVIVVSPGGTDELPASATVADGGVLELHFCGTSGTGVDTGPADADGSATTAVADGATPTGAVGSASGFLPRHLTINRSGSDGGATVRLSVLGAAVGAALGGAVLLLSRTARDEVIR